ncbi:MAG TPA: hypothetical protein VN851_17215 [Thermoanaerobaculia bacterium]|nr:hypothetical protein [Thermoanaerobaculia bacterium]
MKLKKLALSKETVKNLLQVELGKVAGGTTDVWSSPDYLCQDEFRPLTGLTCDC